MARIEFVAGLYMDHNGPVLPARLVEAAVVEGARKSKSGKRAEAGVIVEKHASLIYDGPRTAKELLRTRGFRLAVPVRVVQAKVVRTRLIFERWSANIEISYLEDIVNWLKSLGIWFGLIAIATLANWMRTGTRTSGERNDFTALLQRKSKGFAPKAGDFHFLRGSNLQT
jgi:hypothetical protein